MHLAHLKWPDLVPLDWQHTVCLVPLGSCEQHGPHLPLITDTCLVTAVAEAVERRLPAGVLLLPTLWLGVSAYHDAFPGTLSLDPEAYMRVVEGICLSLVRAGARKILLLNGHGGNESSLRVALRNLKTDLRDGEDPIIFLGTYWTMGWEAIAAARTADTGNFGHASEAETSLMLHIAPALVDMDQAHDDGLGPRPPHLSVSGAPYASRSVYTVIDFHEVSPSGPIGHARTGTAEKGLRMFEGVVEKVAEFVGDLAGWER